jgi:tRNA A64-2'-O-ribosylphosphate transferase
VAFHPIVLCTASRRVNGAEASEGGYVQGAADDHEAWSHGLTPPVFWKHKDVLMTTSEEDAPALISKLIDEEAENSTSTAATLVSPTCNLYISSTQNIDLAPFDAVVSCAPKPFAPDMLKAANTTHSLNLKCQTGKLGSRDLRTTLPLLAPFLSTISIPSPKILLCCPTGTDLAVGTALAILCLYASDSGVIDLGITRSARDIDKHFIKQRLAWITTSNPALNPSRATLQSVNSTLLTNLDPKTAALPTRLPTDPAAATVPAIPVLPDPQTTSRPEPSTPARIFTHLANHTWCFHRHLTSALPSHPSGTVSGTATLTPHLAAAVPTLVYAEDGTFTTTTGLTMRAKRRYVYQLTSPSSGDGGDGIVVRFFDDDAAPGHALGPRGEGVGGVFVEMGVLGRSGEEGVWEAKSRETHLCG